MKATEVREREFRIILTARKVGALGLPEFHPITVKADSTEAAYEAARRLMYERGYEHVHCLSCAYDEGR